MTTTTATDFYALLGVDPDATTAQIKSAYRKLAKQYHPDVNNSPDAAEKFREITEAYDTLTDPDRRSLYDLLHGTGRTTFGDGERSRLHQARQRHPHRKRLQGRQPQRLPGRQPDPEDPRRDLAGNPPLAPGHPPGRHHHRQRHRQ